MKLPHSILLYSSRKLQESIFMLGHPLFVLLDCITERTTKAALIKTKLSGISKKKKIITYVCIY